MANQSSSIISYEQYRQWLKDTFPRDIIDPTYNSLKEPAFEYRWRDFKNPTVVQKIKEQYFGAKPQKRSGLKLGTTNKKTEEFVRHPYLYQKLQAIHPKGDLYLATRLMTHSAERAVTERVGLFKGMFSGVGGCNFLKGKIYNEQLRKDTHFFMHEMIGNVNADIQQKRQDSKVSDTSKQAVVGGILVEVQLNKNYGEAVIQIYSKTGNRINKMRYLNYLNSDEFLAVADSDTFNSKVEIVSTEPQVSYKMLDEPTRNAIMNLFDELKNYPGKDILFPQIEIRGDKLYLFVNALFIRVVNTSNNYTDPNSKELYNYYTMLMRFVANLSL